MKSFNLWLHLQFRRWEDKHQFKEWTRIEDSGWVAGRLRTSTYEVRRCPCGVTQTRNIRKD